MKKILVGALAACAAISCSKQPSYTINGEVADINGKAVLLYRNPVSQTKVSDTVEIKNGKFTFKGSVEDVVPATVMIIPDNEDAVRGGFYLENAPLTVDLVWSSIVDQGRYGKYIGESKVTGGVNSAFLEQYNSIEKTVLEQEKYKEYKQARENLDKINPNTDYDAYRKALDEMRANFAEQMKAASEEAAKGRIECIKNNPDVESAAGMFAVYMRDLSLKEIEDIFNSFTPKVQNCHLAKEIRDEITALKAVQPGAVAPDFTLEMPDGTDFTLSSLRGKYVLVDFWASWCGPCRASVPHLKELYAKYKDKGFEIVGVTNDTNHDKWKQAIEEDKTEWIHVADVFPEDRGGEVIARYAAHYLPTLYLIDKEGKMIGKMEHTELDAKLKELFGE
ncbi:MAG: AhpC/TSA family protein [Bacteroidales bacterium]|nr:AhpC/TSA family protein [Bacteroidales bacterium]